jgi:hypothetical protein
MGKPLYRGRAWNARTYTAGQVEIPGLTPGARVSCIAGRGPLRIRHGWGAGRLRDGPAEITPTNLIRVMPSKGDHAGLEA